MIHHRRKMSSKYLHMQYVGPICQSARREPHLTKQYSYRPCRPSVHCSVLYKYTIQFCHSTIISQSQPIEIPFHVSNNQLFNINSKQQQWKEISKASKPNGRTENETKKKQSRTTNEFWINKYTLGNGDGDHSSSFSVRPGGRRLPMHLVQFNCDYFVCWLWW